MSVWTSLSRNWFSMFVPLPGENGGIIWLFFFSPWWKTLQQRYWRPEWFRLAGSIQKLYRKADSSKRAFDCFWTNNENNQASNTLWVDICVRKTIRFFFVLLSFPTHDFLFAFSLSPLSHKICFLLVKILSVTKSILYTNEMKHEIDAYVIHAVLCCVVLHNTQPTRPATQLINKTNSAKKKRGDKLALGVQYAELTQFTMIIDL